VSPWLNQRGYIHARAVGRLWLVWRLQITNPTSTDPSTSKMKGPAQQADAVMPASSSAMSVPRINNE